MNTDFRWQKKHLKRLQKDKRRHNQASMIARMNNRALAASEIVYQKRKENKEKFYNSLSLKEKLIWKAKRFAKDLKIGLIQKKGI